jgi:hypothetical protein
VKPKYEFAELEVLQFEDNDAILTSNTYGEFGDDSQNTDGSGWAG